MRIDEINSNTLDKISSLLSFLSLIPFVKSAPIATKTNIVQKI